MLSAITIKQPKICLFYVHVDSNVTPYMFHYCPYCKNASMIDRDGNGTRNIFLKIYELVYQFQERIYSECICYNNAS